MKEEVLIGRSRGLLRALIQEYIHTGEPVGSRRLSELSEEGLSPATIRNMMADLEASGYVCQPHTSAGRIPTEKGYRFYVDVLLERKELSGLDISEINHALENGNSGASDLLSRASNILSTVSNNVGFVVAPTIHQMVLRHAEFLRLTDRRVLVIIVGQSGIVQNRVILMDEDMSQLELDYAGKYLVANFAGLTLPTIRRKLLQMMKEEKALYDRMLQQVVKLGTAGLEDSADESNVFVDGTARLIRNREFADVKQMIEIFEMFEHKSRLVKIISECIPSQTGPKVTIGIDAGTPAATNFAMVTSAYVSEDQTLGALGVLGPKRMEYARAISLVDHVAKAVEKILNRN